MALGIEAISAYVGRAFLDVRGMFQARGLDMSRFANLMMERRSVNVPCEDPVTNAVNAAKPIVDALDPAERDRIEVLVVGTESGLDFGKPISTYVHHHLGLSPNCRSFEVKHACYGGTAALQTAAGMVAANPVPGVKALAVATDAASATVKASYWEPSEGAGAVAMLVGDEAKVLEIDRGASGFHTFEVMDTLRPRHDMDSVDPDLSLLAYMRCVEESFAAYQKRVAGADIVDTFTYLAMHTPFAGMVKGAHRSLLRKQKKYGPREIEADFTARVVPTLTYGMRVGNTFSAALYLALCSLLDHGDFTEARRIGLFSYGSGCASEFYSGVVPAGARPAVDIGKALDDRREITVDDLDLITDLSADRIFGVRDAVFDPKPYADLFEDKFDGRGLLVLDRIAEFHREYRWS
ncbi:hydroxymethylglutaryl-CoA synthase [Sphaerisporangium rubeum]|uniref:Polyketide biosynthesis 3-hydroxy-3-methylglutaryl-CoA synthase-like enzyme PksG n=1 Tax=Sphaerisporangium rubeum TaxID=321317 RepID=A0A7X0M8K7_9ACTN|nr:polyketide biosynthesis 3-hydroxy-3-methylglutaryl-CoA synthase-like enzyme PksG [Sphaerisporangium rubeum]